MSTFGIDNTPNLKTENLLEGKKFVALIGQRSDSNQAPTIAFGIKEYSVESRKATTDIFINYAKNFTTNQLTRNAIGSGVHNPVLAIDLLPGAAIDMLLYLKNGQVWCLPINGGEASQVTNLALDIDSFKLFKGPNNQISLALVMEVYANKSPKETKDMDTANDAEGQTGQVYDKLMVRHWDRWGAYKKRNHVFICPLTITSSGLLSTEKEIDQGSGNGADGLHDLMFGLESDCPGKAPGLGDEEYSISPDGTTVALACRRVDENNEQKKDFSWSTDVSIFLANVPEYKPSVAKLSAIEMIRDDSSNKTSNLIENGLVSSLKLVSGIDFHGNNGQPSFSPDGKKLAFLSMERPQYESDKNFLRILDIASGTITATTSNIDLSFNGIEWGLDSDLNTYIYSTVAYHAVSRIVRINLGKDQADHVLTNADLDIMSGDDSRSCPIIVPVPQGATLLGNIKVIEPGMSLMYYLETNITSPNELKLALLKPNDQEIFIPFTSLLSKKPIEEGNQKLISLFSRNIWQIYCPCPEYSNGDITMPDLNSYWIRGGGGDLVHCWYLPPCDGKKIRGDATVPLVLVIHGGPQGAIMNSFHYRWNMCSYAARGFGVVTVNFHGSTSYGQDFCDSIRNDWGGKPFEDNMAAVDYVLNQHKYLDSSRVAALGASYGGYMINWINGHTDRFKCLVNHDGIFSLKQLYYTTEEQYFPEYEFGIPYENEEVYAKWSPDTYIKYWKTPTLVIHGGKDYRVCETEGIATFTALQRKGIESKLLFFPDENHWVLKPLNSLKWHNTIFEWLDHHLTSK